MAELIDVKMMPVPKGSTSVTSSGGTSRTYVTTTQQADTARYARTAGTAEKADLADRATYAEHAGTADRATYADTAGRAETLTETSEVWEKLLRKDVEDTARELVTFLRACAASTIKTTAATRTTCSARASSW